MYSQLYPFTWNAVSVSSEQDLKQFSYRAIVFEGEQENWDNPEKKSFETDLDSDQLSSMFGWDF